jgi:hypothetical protein
MILLATLSARCIGGKKISKRSYLRMKASQLIGNQLKSFNLSKLDSASLPLIAPRLNFLFGFGDRVHCILRHRFFPVVRLVFATANSARI